MLTCLRRAFARQRGNNLAFIKRIGMSPWLTVVGIGEDGFAGLGKNARRALLGASRVIGSQRQLDLLPACIRAERQTWPGRLPWRRCWPRATRRPAYWPAATPCCLASAPAWRG